MNYFVKEHDTRYFAGIELIGGFKIDSEDKRKIPLLWDEFVSIYLDDVIDKKIPHHYIGLEIYRIDFVETKKVDYYAMIETEGLIESDDLLVTKKLPKGKYVYFPIAREHISQEIKNVYQFIKNNNMMVHLGFHVEEYSAEDESSYLNNTLYLSFRLEE